VDRVGEEAAADGLVELRRGVSLGHLPALARALHMGHLDGGLGVEVVQEVGSGVMV